MKANGFNMNKAGVRLGVAGSGMGGLQRKYKAAGQVETASVPSSVHQVLRLGGQGLHADTRAFMESRFGRDFSQVRVHTGTLAAESAQEVNALAYTIGQNVMFGAGQYTPHTVEGRQLIAHELTHVIHQEGLPGVLQHRLRLGPPEDRYEQEAERTAISVIKAEPGLRVQAIKVPPTLRLQNASAPQLQKAPTGATPKETKSERVPKGIALKEIKSFGHADLTSEEDKQKTRTCIGAITLMGLTPPGDYSEGEKRGDCVKEFLTEVSNTCPTFEFCSGDKCFQIGRYGTAGDDGTKKMVTDGPDSFIDRHVHKKQASFLEGSGKDSCSVVCHQRYKYRTEPDKIYHDLGSFYIIRNFRADKYMAPGSKKTLHITTGEVKKVPAGLEAPEKEKFAKSVAPNLKKSGDLADAPPP